MKIKHAIARKLLIPIIISTLIAFALMMSLLVHMNVITSQATEQLGALYMSEMMGQMQDHFDSIVEIKTEEADHIVSHVRNSEGEELRDKLRETASQLGFEYLALYSGQGTSETVLGDTAWYRDINSYINAVTDGENVVTTGYLTDESEKYVVFGVPASYEMSNGTTSNVMLVGFSVEKLYDYIYVDNAETLSKDTRVWIILTNGAYVYRYDDIDETSFFDHIRSYGGFATTDTETGIARIESSIANGNSFSCAVSGNDGLLHMYGAPVPNANDWYFVLSMPKGANDEVIDHHSSSSFKAFAISGVAMLAMFCLLFFMYMRFSIHQLSETEVARAEAEKANRAKSTFLFNASHDIRTPMNAIIGFSKIIAKDPDDTEMVRKNIGKINQSGETLMQLLNDVLELSQIESNKIALEPVALNLEKHIENMQTMFNQEMQNSGIEFTTECNVTDKVVICDSLKLTRILMNLLSNARKFTPEGGSVVCGVEQLSAENDCGRYRFYVNDTGIGMSEEFQARAFEQFERERTSTDSGMQGSGLGLSIIKHIVDMMGGECVLKSTLGKGTCFDVILSLPFSETPAEEKISNDTPKTELSGRHILLVEDNELNREITRYIIESLEMTADEATDGSEALRIITEQPADTYDAILMDIQMPVMDGFTASGKIREMDDSVRSSIPIIALTANAFREDRERCLNAGMNAHICKPVNSDELYDALVNVLNKKLS